MFEAFKKMIEEFLLSNNIDIHNSNYKNSENYKKIQHIQILKLDKITISLDEFVESYLLKKKDIYFLSLRK